MLKRVPKHVLKRTPERTPEHGAQAHTFKMSQLGTTRSYEGLAEHGKRYIPKLAGKRVPDAFRRLSKNMIFSKLIKVKNLKSIACK